MLGISQTLHSPSFQWSFGIFFLVIPWSDKKKMLKTHKASISWLLLTSHSSLQKLVFPAMCDPSYCIRLLPSCLAGHNLLFSQFLSAIEGI